MSEQSIWKQEDIDKVCKSRDAINDGGSAFPIPSQQHPDGRWITIGENGMSLRDYFAGQALMSIVFHDSESRIKYAARLAYVMADAMILERNKP